MNKKRAVIFDVDGTLAHMSGRISRHGKKAAPYLDNDAYDDDIDPQLKLMNNIIKNNGEHEILIVSGRKDSSYQTLVKWLNDNEINFDSIHMRRADDNRKDSIVKKEIYENHIKNKYNIDIVFDDRDQVVDMWRNELGLKCFQVQDGNF